MKPILPCLLFFLFCAFSAPIVAHQSPVKDNAIKRNDSTENNLGASTGNSYVARYERYGLFGMYHVSLAVDVIRGGVRAYKLHIAGAGRLTKYEINLGFCNIKFRCPPAFLAGSVNPRGYERHFLGLLTSEEFGPKYTLTEAQGARLVSLAHHGITEMNSGDKLLYCTIPFCLGPIGIPAIHLQPRVGPLEIFSIKTPAIVFPSIEIPQLQTGSVQFWTSNSVVASLVQIANEEGINLPKPADGCYPGFDGPYLPKSLYEYQHKTPSPSP